MAHAGRPYTLTGTDTYIPTPAEAKIIEALANPANKQLSVSAICQLAGVSRQTYYEMFKKPEFVEYYQEFQRSLIKSSVGDIIKAMLQFALSNPKNHQDRKMLLEMATMYTQKTEIEHAGTVTQEHKHDLTKLSAEELATMEQLLSKSTESE